MLLSGTIASVNRTVSGTHACQHLSFSQTDEILVFYFQIKGERGLPGGPGSVVLFCLFYFLFHFCK